MSSSSSSSSRVILPPLRPYHHHQIQQSSSSQLYPPYNYRLYTFPSQRPSFSCPPLPLSYQFEGPHDHINPSLPPTATYYRWSKPLGPFCTLNTDGSVAKGRSGIGGIVRNSHGDPILAFASRCPKMPVYAVELWAIRRGLQLALSSGVRYVNVDTDSTEAVKCVYSLPANCPLL
ncbi:Hva22-like protein, partial [Thalictrum thalictroides]